MAEALERWPVDLFREQLPRIYAICQEINRRLMEKLHCVYPNDPGKWEYMAAVTNSEVRMANLCPGLLPQDQRRFAAAHGYS